MNSESADRQGLLGYQRPRLLSAVGDSVGTTGADVRELAESCGLYLDDWQEFWVDRVHDVNHNGLLTYNEVGNVVARQNGKGTNIEATELGWLFLSEEELVLHSAHEFKTSADAYKRISNLIKQSDELVSQVKSFCNTHGQEGIKLKDTRELKFIARTTGSGRGFPAKKVVMDEAYNITDAEMSAILPTLKAAEDPQIIYTSSAVNSDIHANGHTLAKIRRRGLAMNDPSLLWMEWSAPEGCPHVAPNDIVPCDVCLMDRVRIQQANPGLGHRISMAAVERDFKSLSAQAYACEDLSIGKWPEPEGSGAVINIATWDSRKDTNSKIVGPRVFSVDVAPMGKEASIGVSGINSNGQYHVEVVESRPGTSWLVPRMKEINDRWEPMAVVVDMRSATSGLVQDLIDVGVPVMEISTGGVTQAFSGFCNKVLQLHNVVHIDQPVLTTALKGAVTRNVGDALAWDRRHATVDITGLVAITNALWGFVLKTSEFVDVVGSVW